MYYKLLNFFVLSYALAACSAGSTSPSDIFLTPVASLVGTCFTPTANRVGTAKGKEKQKKEK